MQLQHLGKTYTLARSKWTVLSTIEEWIDKWFLEVVGEEKEIQPTVTMHIPACWSGKSNTGWSPTPWELIEVSNDGEKWEKKYFERINEKWLYRTEFEWLWAQNTTFKFARPIQWIEKVPDFVYEHLLSDANEIPVWKQLSYVIDNMWKNLASAVTALNLVIDKLNSK